MIPISCVDGIRGRGWQNRSATSVDISPSAAIRWLIAVAAESQLYRDIRSLNDLPSTLVEEIEHFWVSYNEIKGKRFTPIGRGGRSKAKTLVENAKK